MRDGINGLHHVGISVPDMAAAKAFYVDLLGLAFVNSKRWVNDRRMDAILGLQGSAGEKVLLESPGLRLELWCFDSPAAAAQSPDRPVSDHGISHFCLQVDDLLSLHPLLAAGGMRFLCEPSVGPTGSVAVYGRDPFGNAIELFQAPGQNARASR